MIRKAVERDIDQVEESYTELLRYEQEHGAYTVWKLGVYPTRVTAEEALKNGALYVMEQEGEIWGSVILDRTQPKEYEAVNWSQDAGADGVLVIHLLCVRPSKAGRGIGRALVEFALKEGRRLGLVAVRLDTGAQNKPAVALYKKLGFSLAGTGDMAVGGRIAHRNHLFFEKRILERV